MPHPFRAAADGTDEQVCTKQVVPARGAPGRRALRRGGVPRFVGHDHWACRPRSGRGGRRTGLYEFGSSCTGAPSRRALRRGCVRRLVGHDHWACCPRSGRRGRRTDLYNAGSSCRRRKHASALQYKSVRAANTIPVHYSLFSVHYKKTVVPARGTPGTASPTTSYRIGGGFASAAFFGLAQISSGRPLQWRAKNDTII